ncbi:transglycosylase domain-containing protein [Patescibacteria group bacterium]|nr:transglycosylase domain-containing protein [Patescibacteria group bacterium]MBU1256746.1 transglycosylase domain-containing protein [Patescibacteria group bacterium]MBU1457594.1 transglycosylase domain-containing protein [Patescibacteria group bacterium]
MYSKRKAQLKKIISNYKKTLKKHPQKKRILLVFGLLTIGAIIFLLKDIPNPKKLTKSPAPVSTQILDRNGKLLYEIYTDQNRTPVKLENLPDHVKNSTISIEDKNFYSHHGLDFIGIARAFFKTVTGQRLEGGSTITQQLVKIGLLQDPSRTITRKIREAILAIATEIVYTKDEILELYLNHAPYGGTNYGIQSAALAYFNKNAKDLNLAEASLLAGLPQAPTRLSPFGANPDLAFQRQAQVLNAMVENGYITKQEAEDEKNQDLKLSSPATTIKAPHFVFLVKELLVDQFGEDRVNLGGLRVTTTLNLDLQEYAQSSLSAEITKLSKLKVGNGAALVTSPNTGEILAMIGSKDYFDLDNDGQVNLTTALRQPGSSIKPVNYAVGLMKGWTASTMFLDLPTCYSVTGQKTYCPRNYDNSFHGPVQLRHALANSYNIPAVKMLSLNGVESMIATASAMGIKGWQDPSHYGLSLTLGGGEVTMMEMATAFGTFANSGVTIPLNPILKVETYTNEVLYQNELQETQDIVSALALSWNDFWNTKENERQLKCSNTDCPRTTLPEEVAFIISNILSDNGARSAAFGSNSQLIIPGKTVSVKTGTTNDLRDNWTIGYTPDFLVATWVGNNDNTPMSYVVSGTTGASTIWNKIMHHLLESKKDHPPTQPGGIKQYQVCNLTGLLAQQENQCDSRSEFFIENFLPKGQVTTKKQVWVRRSDKYPILEGDETIDRDLEEHTVLSDPFVKDFCIDCVYPQNEEGKITWPTTNINYDLFQLSPTRPNSYHGD